MKFVKLWIPVILMAGLIFFFSNIPELGTGLEEDFVYRKIAHMAEYFFLTLLVFRAIRGTWNVNGFRFFIYSTSAVILYAISDEIHQAFVPGRLCAFHDVLVDAIGIFGCYLFLLITKKTRLFSSEIAGKN